MNLRQNPDVVRFSQAAQQFCRLLESPPADPDRWIDELLAAVALLYAYAHALPEYHSDSEAVDVPESLEVSDEEWRSAYALVQQLLGKQTLYWAHFAPVDPDTSQDEPVVGDLADDLADIYRDVQQGLRAFHADNDAYLAEVMLNWKDPLFGSHWGLHAVSALRALHWLALLRGIDGPRE